jgi:hypothetical protein
MSRLRSARRFSTVYWCAKAADGPVEDDSERRQRPTSAATSIAATCHRPSLWISNGARDTTGSRATVAQQEPAARINKAPAGAALSIRHQKKRMILLVAAEHHAGPVVRQVI